MFIWLRTIALPGGREDDAQALAAALQEALDGIDLVRAVWCTPVVQGAAINAGHVICRMVFSNEAEAGSVRLHPRWLEQVEPLLEGKQIGGLGYRSSRKAVRRAQGGIWRALVFRVMPQTGPSRVADLENGLLLMPGHVSAIRSWALGHVAFSEGPKAFTHVWEQEFESLDGLTGEYMTHPVHWGIADAFFDAECPEYCVDPHVIQAVGNIDETIMEQR